VAALRATARDAAAGIMVTVDAGGALVALDLGDRAGALAPQRLADAIMAAVRSARGDVLDQLTVLVGETVGVDSPTGAAVLELQRRRLAAARESR
jgi:hypothetical protein